MTASYAQRFLSIEERFWQKIDVLAVFDCWDWTAGLNTHGYGNFWFEGRTESAHVVAWILANGPVPDGLCVCHSCDNRKCCNVAHLWLGTNRENTEDRCKKDRTLKGEQNPRAKLTSEDVVFIRDSSETNAELGQRFNVTPENIYAIRKHRTWRHVGK